jgi:hypothetical protein
VRLLADASLRPFIHPRQYESIVPLDANLLNRRRGDPPFAGQHLHQAPYTLNARVLAVPVHNGAVTDHVVDHDQAACMRQVKRPFEVFGNRFFVGVDEE